MKVLWFEVTVPSRYEVKNVPIGGWQDSLEEIVRQIPEIELGIAFMSGSDTSIKKIDGVEYFPIYNNISIRKKLFKKYWDIYVENALKQAQIIIDSFRPDIIHVFGTEYPFGQVQSITNVPVVIHIMGAIVPYNNAAYPPNYSSTVWLSHGWYNPKTLLSYFMCLRDAKNREDWERKTWHLVSNYMGRTRWDKAIANILHPGCNYFHVNEALRNVFLNVGKKWMGENNSKLKLLSTGCGTFWKGPDMMLKVAKILKALDIDFEWDVAGQMDIHIKEIVEQKEKARYENLNIRILGFVQPQELLELLCSCSVYVHTAYIENSPNSICEAQIIGVPIVSTNVGGISTLVRDRVDGFLVPANDPWQMAYSIIKLYEDKSLMKAFSVASHNKAIKRHSPDNIRKELMLAYNCVISNARI